MNSEPMAAESKKTKQSNEPADPSIRFRYIGFEVFQKDTKPFFKSEEEKKKYLKEAEVAQSPQEIAEREFSHLFVPSFTRMDKMVLYLSALVLVGGLFMPWFFLPQGGNLEMFFGFNLLAVLISQIGAAFQISWVAGTGTVLAILILAFAPFLGLWLFFVLLRSKSDSEKDLSRLKKVLRWHRLPLVLYLLIFGFSIVGFKAAESPLPFFKEGFNIFSLISEAGAGFWMVLAGHLLAAVKTADL